MSTTIKKQRAWGTDTYNKWDNMDYDDDSETKQKAVPMKFNLGSSSPALNYSSVILNDSNSSFPSGRIKSLESNKNEVWSCDLKPLRVWSASSKDGSHIRPLALLFGNIYPDGSLLDYKINTPAEAPPTAETVLKHLGKLMLNPPGGGKQRRPGKIIFNHQGTLELCYRSLAEVSIEATLLHSADGIADYVKKISENLVQNNVANRGHNSEEKSIGEGQGVTKEIREGFYKATKKMLDQRPWRALNSRRAFKITAKEPSTVYPGFTMPPQTVYVNVVCEEYGEEKSTENLYGLAIFNSRLDSEVRFMPPGYHDKIFRHELRCAYTGMTERDAGTKLKRIKPRSYDLRTGMEIVYSSAEAQKKHWKDVKKFMRPLEDRDAGMKEKRQFWDTKWGESILLFRHVTNIPFDDLDDIDANGFEIGERGAGDDGEGSKGMRYPGPGWLLNGTEKRPRAEDLVWAERLSLIFDKIFDERITDITLDKITGRGLRGDPKDVTVQCHFGVETFEVIYEPILLKEEVERAVKKKRKELDEELSKRDPEVVRKVMEAVKGGGMKLTDEEEAAVGENVTEGKKKVPVEEVAEEVGEEDANLNVKEDVEQDIEEVKPPDESNCNIM